MGLPYPGGPEIARLAERGTPGRFEFPRPMTDRPGLEFSFSGVKTHAVNTIHREENNQQTHADIARAFVDAEVDTLVIKCHRAMEQTGINVLIAAGGVSANRQLREKLNKLAGEMGGQAYFPRPEFCTDNGAMIAYAGCLKLQAGKHEP